MSFVLHPYQSDGLDNLRRALRVHRRVLFQLPTGGGKTVISSEMLGGAAKQGKRAWFVVHRKELVDQTSRTLERSGVDHGFVAAGYPPQYRKPVTLCSVQTLANRVDRLLKPDLIVWDEAHHCAAGTWRKVAEAYPDAFHVGLSATPERLDGKGLEGMFRALVPGPTTRWLIENGYLSRYRIWSQPGPDTAGIKMHGADWDANALTDLMNRPSIMGDAVQHYLSICPNESAVAFCCSVEHAIATRDAFQAAGVVAEELDGSARPDIRKNVVRAFRAGEIKVLSSVDLFGEGFDLPELRAAILLRPTKSLGLYLQQVGRALRRAEGKEFAVILDHAGNSVRHGLPDDEREWALAGRKKRKGAARAPTRMCPNCFGTCDAAVPVCPYCGHGFEAKARDVAQVEGQLAEVDLEAARLAVAGRSARQAETFDELLEIALARGHRSPDMFALGVLKSRGRADIVTEDQLRSALERIRAERGYKRGWVEYRLKHSMRRAEEMA